MASQEENRVKGRLDAMLKHLVTPLTVALVGIIGSQYLTAREQKETEFRFYSELMSQREEADSRLRQEMFNSVLNNFLSPAESRLLGAPTPNSKPGLPNPDSILGRPADQSVLNLELLAYNFHESLDLAPLFKEVCSQISGSRLTKEERDRLRSRVDDVVRKVKEKQISAIEESGVKLDGTIYFESLKEEQGQVTEGGEVIKSEPEAGADKAAAQDLKSVSVEVMKIDRLSRELMVRMIVHRNARSNPDGDDTSSKTDVVLRIGLFDFPMLNNVRLPGGNRCAVVLREFDLDSQGRNGSAEITFVYFPASRASLKDRPYYDELTKYLQSRREGARGK
jgi:hypothetical protein